MKKVGRMGYATEEERQAARRAASRRQTEKRRACRIPIASEPGSSTAEEPEPSTQVLPVPLFLGTTLCEHRCGEKIAAHFLEPTFGSKFFCKVFTTNNELIII